MKLTAVKAKHGDAFILTADGARVLIDGGPSSVYDRFLREHLVTLDDGSGEPPNIDLMMVSHIDADHIVGILDLTNEMIEANEEDAAPPVTITRAWVNTFSDTLISSGLETKREANALAAKVASAFDDDDDLVEAVDGHTKLVLSSVSQGRNLRRNLKTLAVPTNVRFRNRMALAGADKGPWRKGDLSISIIGPTKKEVDRLKRRWAKDLPKILAREEKARAAAASLDRSVFNLSSIVCVAEANGKTMLLTGDARGDTILKWLEESDGAMEYDIFKLPHHGSDRNVTADMFEKITARHYVVSGDGKHGNPEPAMFEMLFEARGDADYLIHMTYGPEELKTHREFRRDGLDVALDEVLDKEPWRRGKLRFPSEGETSICVTP